MFTQCPDCKTTFRVTAQVLRQAEGRVRCGGCGNAFNALEHMSRNDKASSEAGVQTSTETTSDQNTQLLETLDKLAGPEVTLEDTGVEWRVLEESKASEEGDPDATGSLRFVVEGAEGEDAEKPAMLGRHEDTPKPISDAQESLDLPETDSSRANPGERRYDDNTILPDDFGAEDDLDELPFLKKPETPKRRADDRKSVQDTAEFDEAQVDLALGEPDDWVDLLDEVSEDEMALEASAEKETSTPEDVEADSPEEEPAADEPPEEDMPSDIDTQFLLQAEEMGLDTGKHPIIDEDDAGDVVDEFAETLSDDHDEDDEETESVDLEETDIGELDAEETELVDLEETDIGELDAEEEELDLEEALALEEKEEEAGEEDTEELVELEEELTASEAKDEPEPDSTDDTSATIIGGKDVSELFKEGSALVETIIMEGDMVGDALHEKRGKSAGLADAFKNQGPLEDTYSLSRDRVRSGRRAGDPATNIVMTSVVVLAVLLLAQIMHQSRQTLAKYGAFNHTLGSIYRVLGNPVTPEWDIRGWQFETTSNSVDEEQDLLTIYSRIANQSGGALPYPLVHISLTDRWEDIIGSRVLEPNEYLAGDLDPRKPVPTGESFTAVITIESPSAEATGFKLTVCYRVAAGQVRCATQDFKN